MGVFPEPPLEGVAHPQTRSGSFEPLEPTSHLTALTLRIRYLGAATCSASGSECSRGEQHSQGHKALWGSAAFWASVAPLCIGACLPM